MVTDGTWDPDAGGPGDTLDPFEATDSDEVRNNDGDTVVDPPDTWIEPAVHESLDEKLAEEEPDISPDSPEPDVEEMEDGIPQADFKLNQLNHADKVEGVIVEDSRVDRLQIDGTPEDGDSFFDVLE
ncbi:hypothetical protein [Mycobacterium sp.]|uniref:hypothetical protein n=1 Tax=Mycobacterium sp. TaxID=1785 RepID=UPI002C86CF29|nr:hypothetical protein [Mycobacterium sp.]HME48448.1 hypothetical protein [Mycobacterium sp.]